MGQWTHAGLCSTSLATVFTMNLLFFFAMPGTGIDKVLTLSTEASLLLVSLLDCSTLPVSVTTDVSSNLAEKVELVTDCVVPVPSPSSLAALLTCSNRNKVKQNIEGQ